MLWGSFASLFPYQALINKLNNEMQKAQNSTSELLAGRSAAAPAGGMKGKNKLGLQPVLACPCHRLLWQLTFFPELISASDTSESWAPLSLCFGNHVFSLRFQLCVFRVTGVWYDLGYGNLPWSSTCGPDTWGTWRSSVIGCGSFKVS